MEEEIEYLEEYEDIIKHNISTSEEEEKTEISTQLRDLKIGKDKTGSDDGEDRDGDDSSSIDSDIFEELFSNEDDDGKIDVLTKTPTATRRRTHRESLDSLDALVRDYTCLIDEASQDSIFDQSARKKSADKSMSAITKALADSAKTTNRDTTKQGENEKEKGKKKTGVSSKSVRQAKSSEVKPEKMKFSSGGGSNDPLDMENDNSDLFEESLKELLSNDDSFSDPLPGASDSSSKTNEDDSEQNQYDRPKISTEGLPEKARIISDTVLTRLDINTLESIASESSKDVFNREGKPRSEQIVNITISSNEPRANDFSTSEIEEEDVTKISDSNKEITKSTSKESNDTKETTKNDTQIEKNDAAQASETSVEAKDKTPVKEACNGSKENQESKPKEQNVEQPESKVPEKLSKVSKSEKDSNIKSNSKTAEKTSENKVDKETKDTQAAVKNNGSGNATKTPLATSETILKQPKEKDDVSTASVNSSFSKNKKAEVKTSEKTKKTIKENHAKKPIEDKNLKEKKKEIIANQLNEEKSKNESPDKKDRTKDIKSGSNAKVNTKKPNNEKRDHVQQSTNSTTTTPSKSESQLIKIKKDEKNLEIKSAKSDIGQDNSSVSGKSNKPPLQGDSNKTNTSNIDSNERSKSFAKPSLNKSIEGSSSSTKSGDAKNRELQRSNSSSSLKDNKNSTPVKATEKVSQTDLKKTLVNTKAGDAKPATKVTGTSSQSKVENKKSETSSSTSNSQKMSEAKKTPDSSSVKSSKEKDEVKKTPNNSTEKSIISTVSKAKIDQSQNQSSPSKEKIKSNSEIEKNTKISRPVENSPKIVKAEMTNSKSASDPKPAKTGIVSQSNKSPEISQAMKSSANSQSNKSPAALSQTTKNPVVPQSPKKTAVSQNPKTPVVAVPKNPKNTAIAQNSKNIAATQNSKNPPTVGQSPKNTGEKTTGNVPFKRSNSELNRSPKLPQSKMPDKSKLSKSQSDSLLVTNAAADKETESDKSIAAIKNQKASSVSNPPKPKEVSKKDEKQSNERKSFVTEKVVNEKQEKKVNKASDKSQDDRNAKGTTEKQSNVQSQGNNEHSSLLGKRKLTETSITSSANQGRNESKKPRPQGGDETNNKIVAEESNITKSKSLGVNAKKDAKADGMEVTKGGDVKESESKSQSIGNKSSGIVLTNDQKRNAVSEKNKTSTATEIAHEGKGVKVDKEKTTTSNDPDSYKPAAKKGKISAEPLSAKDSSEKTTEGKAQIKPPIVGGKRKCADSNDNSLSLLSTSLNSSINEASKSDNDSTPLTASAELKRKKIALRTALSKMLKDSEGIETQNKIEKPATATASTSKQVEPHDVAVEVSSEGNNATPTPTPTAKPQLSSSKKRHEIESLKKSMPKEMIDRGNNELLAANSNSRHSTKRMVVNTAISPVVSASGRSPLQKIQNESVQFKTPPAPRRSQTLTTSTPIVPTIKTTVNKRGRHPKATLKSKLICRKLRVLVNRSDIPNYFKQLKQRQIQVATPSQLTDINLASSTKALRNRAQTRRSESRLKAIAKFDRKSVPFNAPTSPVASVASVTSFTSSVDTPTPTLTPTPIATATATRPAVRSNTLRNKVKVQSSTESADEDEEYLLTPLKTLNNSLDAYKSRTRAASKRSKRVNARTSKPNVMTISATQPTVAPVSLSKAPISNETPVAVTCSTSVKLAEPIRSLSHATTTAPTSARKAASAVATTAAAAAATTTTPTVSSCKNSTTTVTHTTNVQTSLTALEDSIVPCTKPTSTNLTEVNIDTHSNVEPKEEFVDEVAETVTATESVTANTRNATMAKSSSGSLSSVLSLAHFVGGTYSSAEALDASSYGITPMALDESGLRQYSFLHPAKYNRNHGKVALDYCCPNLDRPMIAIDPTRVHARQDAAVREIPAYIVMTTKVVRRDELDRNDGSIPAAIREKVQNLSITNKTAAGNLPPPVKATIERANRTLPPSSSLRVGVTPMHSKPSVLTMQTKKPPAAVAPSSLNSSAAGSAAAAAAAAAAVTSSSTLNALKKLPSTTTITAKVSPQPLAAGANNAAASQQPSVRILPVMNRISPDLRSRMRRYDTKLRQNYVQLELITSAERLQAIDEFLSDCEFTGQDIDTATFICEKFLEKLHCVANRRLGSVPTIKLPTLKNSMPLNTKSTVTSTTTTATQLQMTTRQQSSQPTMNRNAKNPTEHPIVDDRGNIIGYRKIFPASANTDAKKIASTATPPTTATAGSKLIAVNNTATPTATVTTRKSAVGKPVTSVYKGKLQEAPRIFYATPPYQATKTLTSATSSTPNAATLSKSLNAAMNSSTPTTPQYTPTRGRPRRQPNAQRPASSASVEPIQIQVSQQSLRHSERNSLPTLTRRPAPPTLRSATSTNNLSSGSLPPPPLLSRSMTTLSGNLPNSTAVSSSSSSTPSTLVMTNRMQTAMKRRSAAAAVASVSAAAAANSKGGAGGPTLKVKTTALLTKPQNTTTTVTTKSMTTRARGDATSLVLNTSESTTNQVIVVQHDSNGKPLPTNPDGAEEECILPDDTENNQSDKNPEESNKDKDSPQSEIKRETYDYDYDDADIEFIGEN